MGIIAYCATLHCAVLFLILYFPIQFCFVLVRFSLVYSVLYCSVPLHSLVFDFCFCIVLFVPLACCSTILFCVVFWTEPNWRGPIYPKKATYAKTSNVVPVMSRWTCNIFHHTDFQRSVQHWWSDINWNGGECIDDATMFIIVNTLVRYGDQIIPILMASYYCNNVVIIAN